MTEQNKIPTHTSDLINDVGYVAESKFTWENLSGKPVLSPVAITGSYIDLKDKPGISAFENDCGYVKQGDVDYNALKNLPKLFSGNFLDLINLPVIFSGDYNDLKNKPKQFSGSFIDLIDIPSFFSGDYNDLKNKPTLFSGNYKDLNGVPALFGGDYAELRNKPALFSGSYNDLTDKPEQFSGNWEDLKNVPAIDYASILNTPAIVTHFDQLAGKPLVISDEWNPDRVDYLIGCIVIFENNAYRCIKENQSMPVDNDAFWTLIGPGRCLPVPAQAVAETQPQADVVFTSRQTVQDLGNIGTPILLLDPKAYSADIITMYPTDDKTILLVEPSLDVTGARYIIRNRSLDSEVTLKNKQDLSVLAVISPKSHVEIVCDGHDWLVL